MRYTQAEVFYHRTPGNVTERYIPESQFFLERDLNCSGGFFRDRLQRIEHTPDECFILPQSGEIVIYPAACRKHAGHCRNKQTEVEQHSTMRDPGIYHEYQYQQKLYHRNGLQPQSRDLTEDKKQLLDEKLHLLLDMADHPPAVRITRFIPDEPKAGGSYETVTCKVASVDTFEGCVVLTDKRRIPIQDISDIEI